jgi:glycosyltransferase involved in cell wall biosynthesis
MSNAFSHLVSIVTPTYNHEPFIAQCVDSVLAQSYSNWEQIIIDDGSTDRTAEIVAQYKDPRIRYFHQDNAGIENLAHTYNRALSLSRGQLVAILEGDDFWPATKLSQTVPAFEDSAVVLAYGEMSEADIHGHPAKRRGQTSRNRTKLPATVLRNDPPPSAAAYMLTVPGHSLIEASTVVMRKSALDAIGGFQHVPGRRAVDFPTFIRLTTQGKFSYSPEVLGYRRMHPDSVTALWSTEMLLASQAFLQQLVNDRAFVLDRRDRLRIARSWRYVERANEFTQGRLRLLDGRWEDSRAHFSRAISPSQVRISAASIAGWCLSWLHCSMETLFQLAGRSPMRTQKQ